MWGESRKAQLIFVPAEGEGAKVLVDDAEEVLGSWQPQGHVAHVEVLHVVGALHVLLHTGMENGGR